MTTGSREAKGGVGLYIFLGLVVALSLGAILAVVATGPMGIEERFSSALGMEHDGGLHDHDEGTGIALEGVPLWYAGVLVLICMVCWALYRKFGT